MYDNVFISYAKEDSDTAEKLFNFLTLSDYKPWFDKKKLLPGQNWKTEIGRALKKADFIILLLSKISVAKRGFVQREFRTALDYYEEKFDTDIYIIPCKIDDCEVPDNLNKFQWIELSRPDSFDLILKSLNLQTKKYEAEDRAKIAMNASFEFQERSIQRVVGSKPKNSIDIVYPQFVDINNEDLKVLNTYIECLVFKESYSFGSPLGEGLFEESRDEEDLLLDNEFQLSYKIELLSKDFICYTIFIYTYTGGAHGMYRTIGYNYRLNPLIEFDLKALLDYQVEALQTLHLLCKQKLLKKAKDEFEIDKEEDFFLYPLGQDWETFSNFYLKKDGLVILFGVYELTAFAFGEHEVEITFDELLSRHENLRSLQKVKELLRED